MAASREANDADALRVDAPFGGATAEQAHGALRILKGTPGRFAFDVVRPPRHAILENDAGHTDGVEPGRDLLTLEFPIEIPIAASGADENGRAGFLVRSGPGESDGGFRDGGNEFCGFGDFDLLALEFRRQLGSFGADVGVGFVGCCAWPKLDNEWRWRVTLRCGRRVCGDDGLGCE